MLPYLGCCYKVNDGSRDLSPGLASVVLKKCAATRRTVVLGVLCKVWSVRLTDALSLDEGAHHLEKEGVHRICNRSPIHLHRLQHNLCYRGSLYRLQHMAVGNSETWRTHRVA